MTRRRPLLAPAGPSCAGTLLLAVLAATSACATPAPLPGAQQQLTLAEAHVAAGEWDQALAALAPIEDKACPKRLRDRRDLATAQAEFGRGEAWRAYLVLERFSDENPHSERRQQVVDLLWQIGKQLHEADGSFLFFWSDRRASRTVFEQVVTRHPDTARLADALRILGDMAFEDGNYELAQQRFRDIILNRPDSDWRFYAQFRFAMSIVAGLQGPDYDLDEMEHAVRELRGFLANQVEDPNMQREAQAALSLLLEWQVERHLTVAEFYRVVGSAAGVRYHLDLATREEFAEAPSYERAVTERRNLLDAGGDRLPAAPAPGGGGP